MKKINVAVCDDSNCDMERLCLLLEKYGEAKGYEIIIKKFYSGTSFTKKVYSAYDVIFMDIRTPDISGDVLTHKIRQADKYIPVIFISSYMDAVLKGYELGIQAYIKKPATYEIIEKEMNKALQKPYSTKHAFFWEEGKIQAIKIYHNKLEYVETDENGSLLHYDGTVIKTGRKLKEYEKILKNAGFFRCNNSYIVNLRFIERIIICGRRYDLVLINGEKVPLSRGNKNACMQLLTELKSVLM